MYKNVIILYSQGTFYFSFICTFLLWNKCFDIYKYNVKYIKNKDFNIFLHMFL